MRRLIQLAFSVIGCLLISSYSYAAMTCTNTSVSLSSITTLDPNHNTYTYDAAHFAANNLLSGGPYNTTNCQGLYSEPKNIGSNLGADPNLGWLGDGLLNGGSYKLPGPGNNYIQPIDPYAFLRDATGRAPDADISDLLLDLQTPGEFIDPGWISLGKQNMGSQFEYEEIDGATTLNLNDVLDINFVCGSSCNTGTWSLVTTPDIISLVQAALGDKRATFDMLAFIFKAGNEWAVFNFNFTDIFFNEIVNLGNTNFDDPFLTPFAFYGSWNTADFGHALSHVGVAARDPFQTTSTDIPEPATLLLFALGLFVFRLYRYNATT